MGNLPSSLQRAKNSVDEKSFNRQSTFWQSEMNVGKVWSNVSASSFLVYLILINRLVSSISVHLQNTILIKDFA